MTQHIATDIRKIHITKEYTGPPNHDVSFQRQCILDLLTLSPGLKRKEISYTIGNYSDPSSMGTILGRMMRAGQIERLDGLYFIKKVID